MSRPVFDVGGDGGSYDTVCRLGNIGADPPFPVRDSIRDLDGDLDSPGFTAMCMNDYSESDWDVWFWRNCNIVGEGGRGRRK